MLSKGAAYLTFLTSTSAGAALLAAGLKLNNDGGARSGYGFDALSALSGGQFYGQKGGDLPETCNSVIQINGDWGFVMLWAGPPVAATSWYPDYPSVMNIAKGVDWGTTDLFPSFGMPSL
jgi:hypothetical protein